MVLLPCLSMMQNSCEKPRFCCCSHCACWFSALDSLWSAVPLPYSEVAAAAAAAAVMPAYPRSQAVSSWHLLCWTCWVQPHNHAADAVLHVVSPARSEQLASALLDLLGAALPASPGNQEELQELGVTGQLLALLRLPASSPGLGLGAIQVGEASEQQYRQLH
jgi:hypothetical protein